MIIADFSGGLNTRVAPHLLPPSQAQIYKNIENESGCLVPLKDKTDTGIPIDQYFTWYYAGNSFFGKTTETYYAEYGNILYHTNVSAIPSKYDGVNTYQLGITAPTTKLTLTDSAVGVLSGTYTYAYTYYNSVTGVESAPNTISLEAVVIDRTITVSGFIASTDPQVTNIRLYRIGGSLTQYTLVNEKANTTLSYVDNLADITIAGNHVLDTISSGIPPVGLKYLTSIYSMLFGSVGDKLYFSDIGSPDSWPAINFIDFDDTITGIGALTSGIIVFTKFKSYIVTGNSPENFSMYLFSGSQGCIGHRTIQAVDNSLLWVSSDGLCASTGGAIAVISMPLVGKLIFSTFYTSAVLDNVYYLSYLYATEIKLLAFDFRYNRLIREMVVLGTNIVSANDKLYQVYQGTVRILFNATTPLSMHYKSPMYVEGSYTNYKTYKDVYIQYSGTLQFKVYIDKVLINTVNLVGTSMRNIKLGNGSKGYGIEFEITGTGEVYQIEYTLVGRQDG